MLFTNNHTIPCFWTILNSHANRHHPTTSFADFQPQEINTAIHNSQDKDVERMARKFKLDDPVTSRLTELKVPPIFTEGTVSLQGSFVEKFYLSYRGPK